MKKQLLLYYNEKEFVAAVWDNSLKVIEKKQKLDLDIQLSDSEQKNKISDWICQERIFKAEYEDYVFCFEGFKQTFVPNELFQSSSSKDLLKLNFKEIDHDCDFKRIAELGLVSVFEFPLWLKSLLVIKFPHVSLFHKSVSDLKGIFNYTTFKEKTYLVRENDALAIYRVAQGNLLFFNRYKAVNWEDLVYYSLLVLNNEKASKENEIFLCNFKDELEVNKMKEFIKSEVGSISKESGFDNFSIKSQRLCV